MATSNRSPKAIIAAPRMPRIHNIGPGPVKARLLPDALVVEADADLVELLLADDCVAVAPPPDGGATAVLKLMGTVTLSNPRSAAAITQVTPAATCADVGGQG